MITWILGSVLQVLMQPATLVKVPRSLNSGRHLAVHFQASRLVSKLKTITPGRVGCDTYTKQQSSFPSLTFRMGDMTAFPSYMSGNYELLIRIVV